MEDTSTGDFIYQLAASASFGAGNSGVCFVARNTGLFRSDDGGKSWTAALAAQPGEQTYAITAVSIPADFEHDHNVICGLAGGLLYSPDGGKSWQAAGFTPPAPMVTALALSPKFSEDGIALAGTMQDGVLRSADRGRNWTHWNFALLDLSIFSLALSPDFSQDETVYVGTETGVFRSTNGGRAWREISLPVDFDPVLSLAVSPNFSKDEVLFAGLETKGLLMSRDGGDTWISLGEQFLEQPVNVILLAPDFEVRQEVLAVAGGSAWLSRDGGQSWDGLWPELVKEEREISTVYAPSGFQPGQPAWVGLYGGDVLRLTF